MATPAAHDGLRKRSIGFKESLALSVEAMGPLLGAIAVAPLIAISAGFSAPFMVLVCGIAMFIVALTITRFARVLPSAASIYSYVSHGLGERTGFLSAWLSFMYYVLFVPQLLLAFGLFAHSGLDFVFAISIPWWVCSIFAAGVALTLSLVGIRISTRIDLSLAILANIVLFAASLAIFIKVASHGSLNFSALLPTHAGGGFTGLSLAVATGVLIYLGFEQSFTLGEEVKDPHGNVPKAIFTALISIGLLLLFATFAMVSAFGLHGVTALANANSADGTPWWAAFSRVGLGSGWRDALSLVIIISILGNTIASHNCVVRIQYGMGRAKALPSAFGRTGARQTPYFAICVQIGLSVLVTLIMGARLEHDDGVRVPRLHQRARRRRRVHPDPARRDGLLPACRAGGWGRAQPARARGRDRDPRAGGLHGVLSEPGSAAEVGALHHPRLDAARRDLPARTQPWRPRDRPRLRVPRSR